MNLNELKILQNLPLEIKIKKTELRIKEAIERYGSDGLYVSYSGGKDSTVLMEIVKKIDKRIPAIFCDTGLEYPELRKLAIGKADVVIKPEMNFKQVITKYGYPCISKSQAFAFRKLKTMNLTEKYRRKLLYGDERGTSGKLSNKWHFLLEQADFKISEQCCDIMKKKPFHKYEKETNRIPIVGTMACESDNRKTRYVNDGGCNAFECKMPHSQPLGFWTEQDILEYIKDNDIEIPSVYGKIVFNNGKLTTTKEKRTGCAFCMFGCHLEPFNNNRFTRMSVSHPQLYSYCLRGGKYDDNGIWVPHKGLGMAHVLDSIGVSYQYQTNLFERIDL